MRAGAIEDRHQARLDYAVGKLVERITALGGVVEDSEGRQFWRGGLEVTGWEQSLIRSAIKSGLLVREYREADGELAIMAPVEKPPAPADAPYDVSPAVLAMRERRKALGR